MPITGEARQVDAAILGTVARADRHDANLAARAAGDQRGIGFQQPNDAGADGAEPGERDAKRCDHSFPLNTLSGAALVREARLGRSDEHTSELQSLLRHSYAVF